MKISITQEEWQVIEPILHDMSLRAKYIISLDSLLENWSNIVGSVESGYQYTIYDYTNDLSTRDLIACICNKSPRTLQKKLEFIIEPLDQRFKNVTHSLSKPLRQIDSKNNWWWFLIPINPGDELRKDLELECLL